MATYAVIEDGVCTNAIVCDDPDLANENGWVLLDDKPGGPWIGWSYANGQWTPPPEQPSPEGNGG